MVGLVIINYRVHSKYIEAYVLDSKGRVIYSEWLEEFEKRIEQQNEWKSLKGETKLQTIYGS
jgi:hypothetical protein